MASPSRRLFDLGEAARLSKLIASRATVRSRTPLIVSPGVQPAKPKAPPRAPAKPKVRSDRASNATELWHELLEWCRLAFSCRGVFALDDQGFIIATTKHESPLPPEVFSEVNAAVGRLFHDYLPKNHRLRSACLDFAPLGPVSLVPLQLDDASILLGLWGKADVETQTCELILKVFKDELRDFEQQSETGGDESDPVSRAEGASG